MADQSSRRPPLIRAGSAKAKAILHEDQRRGDADKSPKRSNPSPAPTPTELNALRAWQIAIEEHEDFHAQTPLREVWRFLMSEGVIVNGEAYRPPTFEAWTRARRRAMKKARADK